MRGVDLRIEHGERVLLLGPSGAGKSTLLAALAGLLPEDSGEAEGTVEIDGLDPRKARERVGIVFQDPQTQLVMARSGDDVAFGLENRGVPADEIWPRVDEALRPGRLPVPARPAHRRALRRRAAAAGAGRRARAAARPAAARRADRQPRPGRRRPGPRRRSRAARDRDTTLILVEHRVAEALPLVDRVVVLEPGGGVRADGPPDAVFAAHGDRAGRGGRLGAGPAGRAPPGRRRRRATMLVRADRPASADAPAGRTSDVDAYGAGEALAVTGPNGAGKSTLALLLGGLLAPDRRPGRRRAGRPTPTPAAPVAGRRRWPGGSARCSRTRSTSSSPPGSRRAGARPAPLGLPEAAVDARGRAAGPAAAGPAGRAPTRTPSPAARRGG